MKNTKICNVCNIDKDLNEFHKKKGGLYGRFAICKICRKKIAAKKYSENIEEMRLKSELWRKNNPEKRKEVTLNYRTKNKEKLKISDKQYREKNKEKEKKRLHKYYENNREKVLKRNKIYNKNRLKHDDFFRLKTNIRNRINKFLNTKNMNKNNKTFEIVGCSPKSLKEFIENKFTDGMCWELLGEKIHIDHIIPLSSAKTEDEVYKLCHYTNLQPLWAEDNLKKSNKINGTEVLKNF
jgi:hypothetical protein